LTRIPAALCGIVGYKPSRQRVPTQGAFPLSYTLDSIGPLARSVAECAVADAVMAGEQPAECEPMRLDGLRLCLPDGLPLEGLDAEVAARFAAARDRLVTAGIRLVEGPLGGLDGMQQVNAMGGFVMPEAYAIHREMLARRAGDFDPMVAARISRGAQVLAADYVVMARERARLVHQMDLFLQDFDALVLPTCPIVAPRIAEVATRESFQAKNMLVLRNTSIANFFDLCGISLPLPGAGELPVGLTLVARNGADHRLFRIAAAVERLLTQ
jgi:aspartyl-tRNA(Asn)/glutamyl-tRNA(Gln) amidotransferase subunit A